MPRYNVEHKGRWACFTSVADGFVTRFMAPSAYDRWRHREYGRAGYVPLEEANRLSMAEAVEAVFLNRTRREGLAELKRAGLSPADIAELMEERN